MNGPPRLEQVRAALSARLNARRLEMEQAMFARVSAMSMPARVEDEDGEYADGLRRAVSAGVDYGLSGVERGDDRAVSIPVPLLAQARLAARTGVTLDVVLRRYLAGYVLFGDFVMQAVEADAPLRGPAVGRILHAQAVRFERLVVASMGEYTHEWGSRIHPPTEQRLLDQVRKLLAGEPVAARELTYELDDWHVGAIARGDGAVSVLRDLARAADRRLLLVRPEGETAWGWFGGRRRVEMIEIARRVSADGYDGALVALGEPARGLEGWRLTHQQASAVLRIARHDTHGVVRYADVSLLASISQDRVLSSSLYQLYLAPLAEGRDGGAGLRETLRAYFGAGRNISSAASALGISRQTVRSRLHAIEEKLGRTLESCAPEIEVALRMEGGDLVDPVLLQSRE